LQTKLLIHNASELENAMDVSKVSDIKMSASSAVTFWQPKEMDVSCVHAEFVLVQ
jgi:hypothetical protein